MAMKPKRANQLERKFGGAPPAPDKKGLAFAKGLDTGKTRPKGVGTRPSGTFRDGGTPAGAEERGAPRHDARAGYPSAEAARTNESARTNTEPRRGPPRQQDVQRQAAAPVRPVEQEKMAWTGKKRRFIPS
jgi:hypothetical protein